MYQKISQVPKQHLANIKKTQKAWKLILQDAKEENFEKVICIADKLPFTKENLIAEIAKLDTFPDYTILPDEEGSVHVIHYGRSITHDEQMNMYRIFKDVFGILNID